MVPLVEHETELIALLESGAPYTIEQEVSAGMVVTHYYPKGQKWAIARVTMESAGVGRALSLQNIAGLKTARAMAGDRVAQQELQAIGKELQALSEGLHA